MFTGLKKILIASALAFVLILAGWIVFRVIPSRNAPEDFITMAGESFKVELARTSGEQSRGLSGHASLGQNEGMLFIFGERNLYGFWMKDMLFPLDIIWISGDKVAGWIVSAPADDSPDRPVYLPPEPVDRVLEVSAGTAARLGLRVGDTVQY